MSKSDEQQDPMKMDLADLAEMIDSPTAVEEHPEPTEEVEQETEAPGAGEEQELTEEPTDEETPESTEEETTTEEKPPTLEELQEALEVREMELTEARAQSEHFEKVAGRNAGEAGFLKKRLEKIETERDELYRRQSASEPGDYPAEPAPQSSSPPPRASASRLPETMVAQSQQLGMQQFRLEHPEVFSEENGVTTVDPELVATLNEMKPDTSSLHLSDDPTYIMTQTKALLESGLSKLKADKAAKEMAARQSKKADQSTRLRHKKRVAASASGGTASAAPRPTPVDPMKMPLDDLRKEIEKRNR